MPKRRKKSGRRKLDEVERLAEMERQRRQKEVEQKVIMIHFFHIKLESRESSCLVNNVYIRTNKHRLKYATTLKYSVCCLLNFYIVLKLLPIQALLLAWYLFLVSFYISPVK